MGQGCTLQLRKCFVPNVKEFGVDVNWSGFIEPKEFAHSFVKQNFAIGDKCWWPTFLDVSWPAVTDRTNLGPPELT